MADVYLFPQEPNPTDVRLREPTAPAVLHTVDLAVTAVVSATTSRTLSLGRTATVVVAPTVVLTFEVVSALIPPVEPAVVDRGGPFVRPLALTHQLVVGAEAICIPTIGIAIDHAGRRHEEDELVLVGAL